MTGRVFDIQRFSVYDGPGIRTNVFFKGCPLRCLWCHNPESQSLAPELMFYAYKCKGCGKCAEICGNTHTPRCTACGKCVKVCENGAREIAGYDISAGDVLAKVLRDRPFYSTSGGGVTLSGGEPFAQPEFALEILALCKENGIHTAVETCGFTPMEIIKKAAPLTDLFLFDIKGIDGELHIKNTGVSNRIILENARYIMAEKLPVRFRMPYIPGFNDGEFEAVREFTRGFDLELMAYHTTGSGKYDALGREYVPADMPAADKKAVAALAGENGAIFNY